MPRTKQPTIKQQLERKHGKPLAQIIVDTYNKQQTIEGTAAELGMSKSGLQYYIVRLNLYVETQRRMTQLQF